MPRGVCLLVVVVAAVSGSETMAATKKYTRDMGHVADEAGSVSSTITSLLSGIKLFNIDAKDAAKSDVREISDIDKLVVCSEHKCGSIDEGFKDHMAAVAQRKKKGPGTQDVIDAGDLEEMQRVQQALEEEDEEPVEALSYTSFAVGARLGSGGFKTVHKGRYGGRDVAIGVITTKSGGHVLTGKEIEMIEDEIALQETIRETVINGRYICRSYIPRIIGYYKETRSFGFLGLGGSGVTAYYLVMELAGGDLHRDKYSGHQAVGVALQLAYGIHCVHQAGYIHKDVKPLNTLKSKDGVFMWTSDFGLAAKIKGQHDKLSSRWGTPHYMPSERASTSLQKYDVYALGVSFEQMRMTHHLPHGLVRSMQRPYYSRPTMVQVIEQLAEFALADVDNEIEFKERDVRRAQTAKKRVEQELAEHVRRHRSLSTDVDRYDRGVLHHEAERLERKVTSAERIMNDLERELATARDRKAELHQQIDDLQHYIDEAGARVNEAHTTRAKAYDAYKEANRHHESEQDRLRRLLRTPVDRRGKVRRFFTGGVKDGHITRSQMRTARAEVEASVRKAKLRVVELAKTFQEARGDVEDARAALQKARELVASRERVIKRSVDRLNIPSMERRQREARDDLKAQRNLVAQVKRNIGNIAVIRRQLREAQAQVTAAQREEARAVEKLKEATDGLAETRSQRDVMHKRLTLGRTPDSLIRVLMAGNSLT
jgi:serine/threonine protein kinase